MDGGPVMSEGLTRLAKEIFDILEMCLFTLLLICIRSMALVSVRFQI